LSVMTVKKVCRRLLDGGLVDEHGMRTGEAPASRRRSSGPTRTAGSRSGAHLYPPWPVVQRLMWPVLVVAPDELGEHRSGVAFVVVLVDMNVGIKGRLVRCLRCCTSRWRNLWTSGIALRGGGFKPALAEYLVRAGQTACRYSWITPASRSYRQMPRREISLAGQALPCIYGPCRRTTREGAGYQELGSRLNSYRVRCNSVALRTSNGWQ
jgi:hypothetical protein